MIEGNSSPEKSAQKYFTEDPNGTEALSDVSDHGDIANHEFDSQTDCEDNKDARAMLNVAGYTQTHHCIA